MRVIRSFAARHIIIINNRIDNVHCLFFMTNYKCIPIYIEVTSWANNQQTSSQLEVGKWIKFSNCPQNMTCYKT